MGPTGERINGRVRLTAMAMLIVAGQGLLPAQVSAQQPPPQWGPSGQLELDVFSEFSHIRVRRQNNIRTMLFVRDNQQEVIESQLDLATPHKLLIDYSKYMFLSYAFQAEQKSVLIVGLGGGSMVHFLKHYDPQLKVEVVEIDPVVIGIADKYFGIRTQGQVNVVQADGLLHLTNTPSKYDVIYMDAFLKPSNQTDSTGAPLRMKTADFYKQVQTKLNPGGVIVFNLNSHAGTANDVQTISSVFAQAYTFQLPNNYGYVVVGSPNATRDTVQVVMQRAAAIDRQFRATFALQPLAGRLLRTR